jgi:hypothetical protein
MGLDAAVDVAVVSDCSAVQADIDVHSTAAVDSLDGRVWPAAVHPQVVRQHGSLGLGNLSLTTLDIDFRGAHRRISKPPVHW